MLRLATDEDFNNRILRGLLRRRPDLDIVRVQDAGLTGESDAEVLQWASREGRVLLTHDVTTMKQAVDERTAAGLRVAGVFEVGQQTPIAQAIEDILLIAECSLEGEWEGQIRFLPLRWKPARASGHNRMFAHRCPRPGHRPTVNRSLTT